MAVSKSRPRKIPGRDPCPDGHRVHGASRGISFVVNASPVELFDALAETAWKRSNGSSIRRTSPEPCGGSHRVDPVILRLSNEHRADDQRDGGDDHRVPEAGVDVAGCGYHGGGREG